MANLGFAIKASLGLIPGTEKIEEKKKLLEEEYQKLLDYSISNELKEYNELDAYINSSAFKTKKNEILSLNYKTTEEFQKEQRLAKLKKDKGIINYYKVLESSDFKRFTNIETSAELEEFNKLNTLVNSKEHNSKKEQLANVLAEEIAKEKEFTTLKKDKELKKYFKFKELASYKTFLEIDGSEELANYKQAEQENNDEFKTLKKESRFKTYFKFKNSKQLQLINNVESSDKLEKFQELEVYITSNEFTNKKESLKFENSEEFENEKRYNELAKSDNLKFFNKYGISKQFKLFAQTKASSELQEYMKLEEFVKTKEFIAYKEYMLDKNKYSKSEEAERENRYNELKKSDNIKWYLSIKDSDKFNSLKEWNLTFEDNFNTGKIDETKWMNSFFWGEMLIKDHYVIAGEKQVYTKNKNAVLNGTTVKLVTKNEKSTGKVWHPKYGFNQQEFDYTSGMLSTANSFRQQYGKFEAKIKIDPTYPVYQAFWLRGEKIAPEIDVFRYNMSKKNKMEFINHIDSNSKNSIASNLGAGALTGKYFIYTLEWSPKEIKWLINGIEVHKTTQNIPSEPMYVLLSTGIKQDPKGEAINSEFEIDWVRCYDKAE